MPPLYSDEDVWVHVENGVTVAVPVNMVVKKNGELVMGAGLAKAIAERFPMLPNVFGLLFEASNALRSPGGTSGVFVHHVAVSDRDARLRHFVSFPTKRHYSSPSSLELIEESLGQLIRLDVSNVFVPKVGCGLGGLSWERQVRPMLVERLDERFTIPR